MRRMFVEGRRAGAFERPGWARGRLLRRGSRGLPGGGDPAEAAECTDGQEAALGMGPTAREVPQVRGAQAGGALHVSWGVPFLCVAGCWAKVPARAQRSQEQLTRAGSWGGRLWGGVSSELRPQTRDRIRPPPQQGQGLCAGGPRVRSASHQGPVGARPPGLRLPLQGAPLPEPASR